MAVRPRPMPVRPREIFMPFDPEQFGAGAHAEWYRSVESLGIHGRYSVEAAKWWWTFNVRVGEGYYSYGMPYAATEDDLALAYDTYMQLTREALRDRRAEEYDEPPHPARMASRFERADECDEAIDG